MRVVDTHVSATSKKSLKKIMIEANYNIEPKEKPINKQIQWVFYSR